MTIHTIDCETLENHAETPERWLDVAWELDSDSLNVHVARVYLTNIIAALRATPVINSVERARG